MLIRHIMHKSSFSKKFGFRTLSFLQARDLFLKWVYRMTVAVFITGKKNRDLYSKTFLFWRIYLNVKSRIYFNPQIGLITWWLNVSPLFFIPSCLFQLLVDRFPYVWHYLLYVYCTYNTGWLTRRSDKCYNFCSVVIILFIVWLLNVFFCNNY